VAVFGHNEARRIGCCLRAIAAAADGHPTRAIVILNGTTDESATVVRDIASKTSLEIELHTIAIADKSNAINQFLYLLRPEADLYAFVDAYAEIGPQALNAVAAALRRHPDAMAVSGVPMNGRSSRSVQAQTLGNGVLNGQLFALRPDFVRRLTARGIRIPFGLYRGDGLL
jgi:cellulose synthase/poly-beta-1,6-N-acetylglucosamine synthase-like glycosyltransferase